MLTDGFGVALRAGRHRAYSVPPSGGPVEFGSLGARNPVPVVAEAGSLLIDLGVIHPSRASELTVFERRFPVVWQALTARGLLGSFGLYMLYMF